MIDPFQQLRAALRGTGVSLVSTYSTGAPGVYAVEIKAKALYLLPDAIATLREAATAAGLTPIDYGTRVPGKPNTRIRVRITRNPLSGLDVAGSRTIAWRQHGDDGAIAESVDERLRLVVSADVGSQQPNGPGYYIYVSSRGRGGPTDWTLILGKAAAPATQWERVVVDGPYTSLQAAKQQAQRGYAAWAQGGWKRASQPLAGLAFDPGQQVEVKPTFRTGGLPRGKCTVVGPTGVPGMLQLACGGGMTSTVTAKKLRLANFALLLARR